MAITAYVLIVTDPSNTKHVLDQLARIEGLRTVDEVMGPYDIVVKTSADSRQDIPRVLVDRIRTIDGVERTTSLFTF